MALGLLLIQCSLTIDEEELGGEHVLSCASNEKECEVAGVPKCVGLRDPLFGCASRDCVPCNLPNATAICSKATNECIKSTCHPSWEDCNEIDEDGCEVPLNNDVDHCGGCNEGCPPLPHAEVDCGGGHCFIRRCVNGYLDCNGDAGDGCEVDQSDPEHCGDCGDACGEVCCKPGFCCDGSCEKFACGE